MVPAGSGLLALDEDGTACSADYYLRLTADGGRMLKGQLPLTATRPTQPTVATTGTVSLRARANNQYVSAPNGSALIANQPNTGERFDLIDQGNGTIALRARSTNQYVCAENAGAQPLIANRATVGPWETFQLLRNPDGTVSLRAQANNNYVCAENAGAQPLIANRTAIGTWEKFDLVNN
jgi:hypothetical protein